MIGDDRALVDASVAAGGGGERDAESRPPQQYHDLALMVLRDGKWLYQDLRSYVAGHSHPAGPSEAKKEPAAPAQSPASGEEPPAAH
jgi:hypothetical protein